jgi:5-(aminomethyl)-3-furanmethanol phosphate kinase
MLRIVKVGGSLLDWPRLPDALRAWLAEQPPAANVLISGGGKLVDRVRLADRMFNLGNEAAHRMAIDCMASNTSLLADLLGRLKIVTEYNELLTRLQRRRSRQVLVFDTRKLLGEREATLNAPALPHDWTVTSDSIAAWLAELLKAEELVLLKSADRPPGGLRELAAAGYVDAFFPQAAVSVGAVRFVNLRSHKSPHEPTTKGVKRKTAE